MMQSVMTDRQRVEDFIAKETWLLNTQAWDAWNALFSQDGAYWMPLSPQQDSPKTHVSLIYDTQALRAARLQRLKDDDGLSVETAPSSVRHVSGLVCEDKGGGDWHAKGGVMMAEYARERTNTFHGTVQWHLQARNGDFVIELKRVDLINASGVLPDILTYI